MAIFQAAGVDVGLGEGAIGAKGGFGTIDAAVAIGIKPQLAFGWGGGDREGHTNSIVVWVRFVQVIRRDCQGGALVHHKGAKGSDRCGLQLQLRATTLSGLALHGADASRSAHLGRRIGAARVGEREVGEAAAAQPVVGHHTHHHAAATAGQVGAEGAHTAGVVEAVLQPAGQRIAIGQRGRQAQGATVEITEGSARHREAAISAEGAIGDRAGG